MKNILFEKNIQLSSMKDEFRLWLQEIKPIFKDKQDNFISICEYGVTEMVNNIIDHAEATEFKIEIVEIDKKIKIILKDNGVGIFQKILQKFNLDSELHALIELIKGKLTTAPEGHTGEGIFFTSRCFDNFILVSGKLRVEFFGDICHAKVIEEERGTYLEMSLDIETTKTIKSIFDQFCGEEENYVFSKTRFSISIAQNEGNLISRSQAKRIAARLEQFLDVEINFSGVDSIGQGFADELFRVWKNKNPKTQLHAINANNDVRKMISHVTLSIPKE
jgi:anti-sigma regulatory factor (Ser/Thr protein kinase)